MTTKGKQFVTPFGTFIAMNEHQRGKLQLRAIDTSFREKITPGEMLIIKYIRSKGNRAFVSARNIARGLKLPISKVRLGLSSMIEHSDLMRSTAQELHNFGGTKLVPLYALPDMYDKHWEEKQRHIHSPFYDEWWTHSVSATSPTPPILSLSDRCCTLLGWSWEKRMRYERDSAHPSLRHASVSFHWGAYEVLALAGGLYSLEVAKFALVEVQQYLESVENDTAVSDTMRGALAHCSERIKKDDHQWSGKGWDGCSMALVMIRGNCRSVMSVGSVSIFDGEQCVQPRNLPTAPCLLDRRVSLQFGFCPCWPVLGVKNASDHKMSSIDFGSIACHECSQRVVVVMGHGISEELVTAQLTEKWSTANDLAQRLEVPKPSCIDEADSITVLVLE